MNKNHYKVVSLEEMARFEKLAIASGCSEERFIDEAGKKIAAEALLCIETKKLPKKVTLLVGKGNNGADAYAAGIHLIEQGIQVRALVVYPEGNIENEKFQKLFSRKNGKIEQFSQDRNFHFDELILDGLLGIGFRGEIDSHLGAIIQQANDSGSWILAIDVPSGLNATTGAISHFSIVANQTVTLGLPKIGLFLRDGWGAVGKLQVVGFGLPEYFIEQAHPVAYLINEQGLSLPRLIRNRHKYQAGYVVGLSGSKSFKGAPKLAGLSALRAGAGIVRIFHLDSIDLAAPMELICEEWDEGKWKTELRRASALFLGPGLGKSISSIDLATLNLPAVIDADLLQPDSSFPKKAILTPHRGEMLRLLNLKQSPDEETLFSLCQKFVEEKKVVLILKGAPNFIFACHQAPLIVTAGDPGMATAGSGDVLTGILAALLAQKMDPYEAAILGVYLHGIAGEEAAKEKSSYGMIASDLISSLPKAFLRLMR